MVEEAVEEVGKGDGSEVEVEGGSRFTTGRRGAGGFFLWNISIAGLCRKQCQLCRGGYGRVILVPRSRETTRRNSDSRGRQTRSSVRAVGTHASRGCRVK